MFRCLKVIAFFAIFVFLFGFITMSLWNALIPDLFHGPTIMYWQAIGLLVLAKIFFGGFHGGHRGRCGGRGRHWKGKWGNECGDYCGNEWKEQFEKMTPEEKEAWKANFKSGWKTGWKDSHTSGNENPAS